MAGHNELLDALEAVGTTERERLTNAVAKAHQLMGASVPGVASPATIAARVALPRCSTVNTDTRAGFPDATNTGVPAGTILTAVGSIDVNSNDVREDGVVRATRPGTWGPVQLLSDKTVITGADITSKLRQRSNLPLEVNSSRIRASGAETTGQTVDTTGKPIWVSTTLTDCEIWGGLDAKAVAGGNIILVRCDLSGGEDTVILQSATRLQDCYLHDLERKPGSHNDSLQTVTGGGSSVVHCTILTARRMPDGQGVQFPDGWYDPMNAAWMVGNSNGPVTDVLFDDCLIDGGNYSFNNNWVSATNLVERLTVRNCRFGRHFNFGPKSIQDAPVGARPTWTWEGNVWDDTGEPV